MNLPIFQGFTAQSFSLLQTNWASILKPTLSNFNFDSGVITLNDLFGKVKLVAGTQVSLSISGNDITINATPATLGVTSLNTLTGALSIVGTNGIGVSTSGSNINISGSAFVTSVTATSPLFSSGGNTPNISFSNENANLVLAGPTSGGPAAPTFRSLVAADIPVLPYVTAVTATSPLFSSGGTTPNITIQQANISESGFLSQADFIRFNNAATSRGNYITNPDAEVDTSGWNLYNNSGRTVHATLIDQDITYTAVAAGDAGNGINIDYIFHATQPASTPLVTVLSPTHVTVAWYNGPTLANNPTATQLKAAWDAVPGAVAIATTVISGTPSHLQYIVGSMLLSGGGDTAPVNGTGGSPSGVTFTRVTVSPLAGIGSFDLGKSAANEEGQGVSTDFQINTVDNSKYLQVSFIYKGSAGMVLGSLSDVTIWVYDITNAVMIPVVPSREIPGPTGSALTFVGKFFTDSVSINYRLIFHISTMNASAWDFEFDNVVVSSVLNPVEATEVESLVLPEQKISGSVTDHMAVAWIDGASQWVPATSVWNGDQWGLFGFATNIVGSVADIFIRGYMDGFSFGPFAGYNQYVDPANPGGLTPLPSPFTDTYLIMGKAISATAMDIQPFLGFDLVPTKGGLLTNAGANNGTGDQVLAVGANGEALIANSAASLGLQWLPSIVATTPFTFVTATRTLTIATATNSVAGVMSAADHATLHAAVTIGTANGLSITAGQVLSLAAATNSVPGALTAADHTTYSGYAATIALKAPLASPVFTGDVNVSTGNLLISTIGKGLQVKTGTNAKIGTAVLVAGTVTVANTSVTANSRIFLTSNVDGGTPGWLRVSAKTVSTSFVITSSSATDTSTVAWVIIESIP